MEIHFSTLKSVCKYAESGYSQWNEDWTVLKTYKLCYHKDCKNPDEWCDKKYCPLIKKNKQK